MNLTLIADAGLASGHVLAADWLFLLAAVLFVIEAVAIVLAGRTPPAGPAIGRGILVAAGLAALALAWLVL
jgi:hypothetical protein